MIKTIQIQGLGAHKTATTFNLDAVGVTEFRGPSESGKTTILDAVTMALWGLDAEGESFDVSRITDGAKAADVKLTFRKGSTWQRRVTTSRTWTRTATDSAGVEVLGLTEEAFRAKLGPLADPKRCLPIMAPFGWLALYHGANKGRAFRDYLNRVLPGKTDADLLATELDDGEPRDAKAAIAARAKAKADEQQATGIVSAKREAARVASEFDGGTFDIDEIAAAESEVRRWEAVASQPVEDPRVAWRAARVAHARSVSAHADWTQRAARITEPTVAKPAEGEAAGLRAEVNGLERVVKDRKDRDDAARAAQDRAKAADNEADNALARAVEQHADATRRVDSSLSTDAARPCAGVDPGKCRMAAKATAATAAAEQEAARLEDVIEGKRVARADAMNALTAACKAHEATSAAVTEAVTALDAKRTALAAVNAATDLWTVYANARAALGAEPKVLPAPGDEPEAPVAAPRPTEALALLESYRTAETRRQDAERRAESAKKALAEAEAAMTAATVRRERAKVVADLVTSAPGRALRARVSALNRDGVTVEVSDDGEDITVKVDGREWGRGVSTGRRILADVALRDALRVAAGVPYMPIFVDEVQSFGERPLPTLAGPVVLLRTCATESGKIEGGA
jgi:hypothetical protein